MRKYTKHLICHRYRVKKENTLFMWYIQTSDAQQSREKGRILDIEWNSIADEQTIVDPLNTSTTVYVQTNESAALSLKSLPATYGQFDEEYAVIAESFSQLALNSTSITQHV